MEKEYVVLLADGRRFSVRASEFRHSSYNGAGVTFLLGNETAAFVPTASVGAIIERSALAGDVASSQDMTAMPTFAAPRRRTAKAAAHSTNGKSVRNGTKRRARR
jgi:hypothetical protein